MKVLNDYNRNALAAGGKEITYAQLISHACAYAEALRPYLKTEKKDGVSARAAIVSENSAEWIYAHYGVWAAGAVSVPVDFMSTVDELRYVFDDCMPDLVFYSEKTAVLVKDAVSAAQHKPVMVHIGTFAEGRMPGTSSALECDDNDVAVIIYTSGTTGSPKGVMLTFGNISSLGEVLSTDRYGKDYIIYSPDEVFIGILPFHHILPLAASLVFPLAAGGLLCLIPELTGEAILSTCQKYGVTRMFGVPRLYAMFHGVIMGQIRKSPAACTLLAAAKVINNKTFSRIVFGKVHAKFGGKMKSLLSGGSKLNPVVARDFSALGFHMLEGYGMSETSPSMTLCHNKRYKIGTVGWVLPCGEAKIKDGEFCYKGPNVMKGYYNRPAETAAMFDAEGFMHTGDRAEIDKKGFVTITGRFKEIIVMPNGKNINPEEMENEILSSFPMIKDIGILERDGILCAVVQPDFAKMAQDGVVNIRETIKWEVIDRYNVKAAHHKKILDFTVIEQDLPRTRVGKLKRFVLKNLSSAEKAPRVEIAEPDYEEYFLLKEIVSELMNRPVTAGDHMELDLNMDSLDRVELQVRLEGSFGIHLSNEDLSTYPRIIDLAEHIRGTKTKIESEIIDWKDILSKKSSLKIPHRSYLMDLALFCARPFLKFYIRLASEHKSALPDVPVIFAPNHQSHLDGLLLAALLKRKTRKKTYFFAKDRNFDSALRRYFARRSNIVLININKDLKDSIQQMGAVAREGNNIVLFPEGARSRDGSLQNFKKTFAIISRELGMPVIPVAIKGSYDLFSIGSMIPKAGKVKVTFLPPVYPADKDYLEIVDETRRVIAAELEKK